MAIRKYITRSDGGGVGDGGSAVIARLQKLALVTENSEVGC